MAADSEVERLVCDYSRAAAAFGYAPRHDFRAALEQVRQHLLAHPPTADTSTYRV